MNSEDVQEATLDEIEEEKEARALVVAAHRARQVTSTTVVDIAMTDPEHAVRAFEAREQVLTGLRKASLRATRPLDWTLSRDREGRVVATLRKSGANILRKYYGISIFDLRPIDTRSGVAICEILDDTDGRRIAQIWGSGNSAVTGESVYDMRGVRGADEGFTGRGHDSDLREAARTALETKIVRVLSGTSAMPLEELEDAWKGTSKRVSDCYQGTGYGKSSERQARRVERPDVRPATEPPPDQPPGKSPAEIALASNQPMTAYEKDKLWKKAILVDPGRAKECLEELAAGIGVDDLAALKRKHYLPMDAALNARFDEKTKEPA